MTKKELRQYIDSHQEEIEAIKLTLFLLNPEKISLKETLAFSLDWEYKYYLQTKKRDFLYNGLLIIQSYLELGFPYSFVSDHCDPLLEALDLDLKFDSFYKPLNPEKIKLNKAQVERILSCWRYPKTNGLKKPEVVQDIISKVSTNQKGVYTYRNGSGNIYKLVITDSECYFHNQRNNRYYIFE